MAHQFSTRIASIPAAQRITASAGHLRERIHRKLNPPPVDEVVCELEIAVGMLLMGDRDRFFDIVCEPASKEEAVRISVVLAERLITSITMVAHETEEDFFEVWSRQCQFHANDELPEPWPV